MSRVKKSVHALKKRRTLLKKTKGYRFDRSTKERAAREALHHSATYSFDHRKDRKGDFRRLWNVRINAAVRPFDLSYSAFMGALAKKNIAVNRKMLATLAADEPETFKRFVEQTAR